MFTRRVAVETIRKILDKEILWNENIIRLLYNNFYYLAGTINYSHTCYISGIKQLFKFKPFVQILINSHKSNAIIDPLLEIYSNLVNSQDSTAIRHLLEYLKTDPNSSEDFFEYTYLLLSKIMVEHQSSVENIHEILNSNSDDLWSLQLTGISKKLLNN